MGDGTVIAIVKIVAKVDVLHFVQRCSLPSRYIFSYPNACIGYRLPRFQKPSPH